MMQKLKPELLAPAGNMEKLKYAILYGADAVYIGGQNYGLRANNDNFSNEEIKEACSYAHKYKVKVYVTVNIIFHNEDVEGLEDYLILLDKYGVDAIIISDPLVMDIAKKVIPKMEIHISTQQSTLNYEAVNFWKHEGVKRIILGREVSESDIKTIIDKTKVDIEVFIHGAMCSGYSGKCMLSNYLTSRDSNRGGCSQICRWEFRLNNGRQNLFKNKIGYAIAPKDLSMLKYVTNLIDLGVKSFKIEGRMRSIYYLATVLHTYRKAIDEYFSSSHHVEYNQTYESILYRCTNRDAVVQFFDHKPCLDDQYYIGRAEVSNKDFLGVVLDYDNKTKEAIIEQRNFFKPGTEVEIFGPKMEDYAFKIDYIKDEENNMLDAARHPRQIIRIPLKKKVKKDDLMRVRIGN